MLLSTRDSDFIVQKSTLTRSLSLVSELVMEKGIPIPLKTVRAVRVLFKLSGVQLSQRTFGKESFSSEATTDSWEIICEKKSARSSDSK